MDNDVSFCQENWFLKVFQIKFWFFLVQTITNGILWLFEKGFHNFLTCNSAKKIKCQFFCFIAKLVPEKLQSSSSQNNKFPTLFHGNPFLFFLYVNNFIFYNKLFYFTNVPLSVFHMLTESNTRFYAYYNISCMNAWSII